MKNSLSSSSTRFVLLHYHILKNAGSTVEEILQASFRERLCRFDTPDRDGALSNAEILTHLDANPEIAAFSSHQIFYPIPQARGFLFFDLCFLRDPIDRIRSIYDYFRQKPSAGDPMSDLANTELPSAFTRHLIDNWPWTINDVQVNLLANGLVNDQPQPGDFDRAIARMLEVSFLGVVDRFDESLIAGQYALRSVFPALFCAHPRVNISAEGTLEKRIAKFKAACDPPTYDELLRLNAMDFALLDRARLEIDRRFDLVPESARQLRAPRPEPASASAKTAPGILRAIVNDLRDKMRPIPAPNPLFDADFYLAQNPDVRESGMHPALHYELHGAAEGRKPHPWFDPAYYLSQLSNPDRARDNPLAHFMTSESLLALSGGANPHMLFDCAAYSAAHPGAGNPLIHYLEDPDA